MSSNTAEFDIDRYNSTREAVTKDPETGKGDFETVTEWRDGVLGVTRVRSFEIRTDEPEPLGGRDSAIDPMELVLGAIGSCLTIGWVTQAKRRGVELRGLSIRVRAPFDLRGYLGVDEAVRPGFSAIEYSVEVDADTDTTLLEEIKTAAEAGSPVVDNVLNATPLVGEVTAKGT